MANLAPLSTPAGGLGVQGQKRGAERVWGEGRHRMGLCGGGGWGQSPSVPRHKQCPAPTSREQPGPNDFWKVPKSVFQGAWGGEQVSREGEA